MRRNIILAVFLLNLGGCFPLEVDVNEKGELLIYRQEGFFVFDPETKRVKPVLGPGADTPVFARFAPNGRQILAVVLDGKTGEHRFDLISLADGTSKVVYKKAACCYTRFSPNGRFLALTRMATREHKSPKAVERHEESELDVIDLRNGVNKRFTQWKPHVFFRWFRDSKRILAVVMADRDEDGRRYFGHLSEINIGSGKVTRIASVSSSERIFIDLAPDNGKALVVAKAVGPVDRMPALAKDDETPETVHEVNIASGVVRRLNHASEFAIYSPNGRKVLMAVKEEDNETRSLLVADSDGSNAKPIVHYRPPDSAYMSSGGEALALPGWCNDDTIFYLHSQAVFGLNRQAPWLKTVSVDGFSDRVLQPYLDVAVVEAEPSIRNRRRAAVPSRRTYRPAKPD